MMKIERIPAVLASAYEKSARMAIDSYYGPIAEEIVVHLPAGKILDLGTGPGYLPIEIAARSSSVHVIGVDLSRKLIKMANENAARANLSARLQFHVGNAGGITYGDESFDMVISTGMLHSLKDPVRVIQEIYRVLKAGGEAWVFDPAVVGSALDFKKWKASLNLRERFYFKLFQLTGLHKPARTFSRDALTALMEKTACKDYRVDAYGKEIRIKIKKA